MTPTCTHPCVASCSCGRVFCQACSDDSTGENRFCIDAIVVCPGCHVKTVPEYHYRMSGDVVVLEGNLRTKTRSLE